MLSFFRKIDWPLIIIVLILFALSLAAFYQGSQHWPNITSRHLTAIFIGLGGTFLISFLDYRVFKNYTLPAVALYGFSLVLLLLTLFEPAIRGSRSWLMIGGFSFQPSEFAKLTILILLAKYFSQKHVEIYQTRHILVSGFYAALPAVLTLLQPDLGSMMVFVLLWLGMLFFAGIRWRHFFAILMIGLLTASLAWFFALKPYQKDRITAFFNPDVDSQGIGYNVIQARTTFGSGGFWGTFFDRSNLPVLVPERFTDFAFAAYGQRFGFVGVLALFLLMASLLIRIGSITAKAGNNFARLFSFGLITLISTHVFLNSGMSLGLLPITGLPFPFLSYGGSYLVTLMIGLGLVESIWIRG